MRLRLSTNPKTLLGMPPAREPEPTTAAESCLPCPCSALLNSCMSAAKLVAEEPGSGYSQSISTPSRLYWVTKLMRLLTKVVRREEFADRVSKALFSPSFQPPTAMNTLTLLACAAETRLCSLEAFSMGWSPPV